MILSNELVTMAPLNAATEDDCSSPAGARFVRALFDHFLFQLIKYKLKELAFYSLAGTAQLARLNLPMLVTAAYVFRAHGSALHYVSPVYYVTLLSSKCRFVVTKSNHLKVKLMVV